MCVTKNEQPHAHLWTASQSLHNALAIELSGHCAFPETEHGRQLRLALPLSPLSCMLAPRAWHVSEKR